jgi:hypothetical protein
MQAITNQGICFLSLAMWRTLQLRMKTSGLGTAPRKLIEEMREVRSLDVVLPAKNKTIRLRVVSTPPLPAAFSGPEIQGAC